MDRVKDMVTEEVLVQHLDANGLELIEVKRWASHDWIVYREKADAKGHRNITRAQLILDVRLEDFPLSSVKMMWPLE